MDDFKEFFIKYIIVVFDYIERFGKICNWILFIAGDFLGEDGTRSEVGGIGFKLEQSSVIRVYQNR